MKRIEAPCPSCGAPVEFRVSDSLVTVCQHCSSVVARGDRKLEDLGKTAALVETHSPLETGVRGVYEGKSFELVGRTQFRHATGAVWDEWYAAFSNGSWGWLAEAQGKFFLTRRRRRRAESKERIPDWSELKAGQQFPLGEQTPWTVNEFGEATVIAAEGELPVLPRFGQPHRYADLSGPAGRFATFDYGDDPPTVYSGRQVTLEELGICGTVDDDEHRTKLISALQVACPHCSGSLTLQAPDQAERVVCPYCRSELDANKGSLTYLRTLKRKGPHSVIPLGRSGQLFGQTYVVIGFLQRCVKIEGVEYDWFEYLLYNAAAGFRWLVHSDGHWSFVEPLALGEVTFREGSAHYGGRGYRLFQRCRARVKYVLGEFYWKVEVDESVIAADYVAPPRILSVERSATATKTGAGGIVAGPQAEEVNVSHGIYVPVETIAAAFGVKDLPRSWRTAPHQPNPVPLSLFAWWIALLVVWTLLFQGVWAWRGEIVDPGNWFTGVVLLSLLPGASLLYRISFEHTRWEDTHIE